VESRSPTCAILADRHSELAEGIRDLLETTFQTVYIVADTQSLQEGAEHLPPAVIILDTSLVGGGLKDLLQSLRELSPGSRVIALTLHDQSPVALTALASGADGVVLKRCLASDFNDAVDAVLRGETFVSPDFGLAKSLL
jgi:DNA-binding NarL/FixJ family response regulator